MHERKPCLACGGYIEGAGPIQEKFILDGEGNVAERWYVDVDGYTIHDCGLKKKAAAKTSAAEEEAAGEDSEQGPEGDAENDGG